MLFQMIVGKSNDDEDDGQQSKAHILDWFAANGVDSSYRDPVPWNGSSAHKDEIADSGIAKDMVDIGPLCVTNGAQDGRVVQSKTVAVIWLDES